MARSLKARILMLIACFTLALSFTVPAATTVVWAGDAGSKEETKLAYDPKSYTTGEQLADLYSKLSSTDKVTVESKLKDSGGSELVKINGKEYRVSKANLNTAIEAACNCLNDAKAKSATVVSKAKEGVDEIGTFDVSADIGGAATTLSGVQQFVSIVVGILAYLVILGMTLFTAIDICYITMPVFREKCEATAQGGGAMASTNKKTGESKMRFVTDEAMEAVQIGAIGSGKNPLTIYLGKRVLAFIMVAIVIYILITGQIDIIVDVALTFVSGIIDTLQTLGK